MWIQCLKRENYMKRTLKTKSETFYYLFQPNSSGFSEHKTFIRKRSELKSFIKSLKQKHKKTVRRKPFRESWYQTQSLDHHNFLNAEL